MPPKVGCSLVGTCLPVFILNWLLILNHLHNLLLTCFHMSSFSTAFSYVVLPAADDATHLVTGHPKPVPTSTFIAGMLELIT